MKCSQLYTKKTAKDKKVQMKRLIEKQIRRKKIKALITQYIARINNCINLKKICKIKNLGIHT